MGGRPISPPTPTSALPTKGALRLAREMSYIGAFELVLPACLTQPLGPLRNLKSAPFTPLEAAPFVALGAMAVACPTVGLERLAVCLGLEPTTAEGLLAVWQKQVWFCPLVASVAQSMGVPS